MKMTIHCGMYGVGEPLTTMCGAVARLEDQHEADQQEDEQAEDLELGVGAEEARDRAGEDEHESHRDQHRADHDGEDVRHADHGEDRIDREDEVHADDQGDDLGEAVRLRDFVLDRLQLDAEFLHALPDQEQASDHQHQGLAVDAAGHLHAEERAVEAPEFGRGRPEHEAEEQEQHDAERHRQQQAQLDRLLAPRLRQLVRDDRDDDQVVGAERDLDQRDREEGRPEGRLCQ